jgi:hypothetical protein
MRQQSRSGGRGHEETERRVETLKSSDRRMAENDKSFLIVAASALKISSMPWLRTIDKSKRDQQWQHQPNTGDMPRRSAACTDTWFSSPRCTA